MKHPHYDEIMDCLDTNWAAFLRYIEIFPVPIPLVTVTDTPYVVKALDLDGLILSGGNSLTEYTDETDSCYNMACMRDNFEKALLTAALSHGMPILGVCRGIQLINVYYNGQLSKIAGHAGTRHDLIAESPDYENRLPREINSFHNFAIRRENLGQGLIALAHDTENNVEAFYHPLDKILGMMWHPERETQWVKQDCNLVRGHFGI